MPSGCGRFTPVLAAKRVAQQLAWHQGTLHVWLHHERDRPPRSVRRRDFFPAEAVYAYSLAAKVREALDA